MSSQESNFTRISEESNVVDIDTESLPLSSPKLSHGLARWFYQNVPLWKRQKATLEYTDVLGSEHKAVVRIIEVGDMGEETEISRTTFE